jgi:hypothetical protein
VTPKVHVHGMGKLRDRSICAMAGAGRIVSFAAFRALPYSEQCGTCRDKTQTFVVSNAAKWLEEARDAFETSLTVIGDGVRKSVVQPFCKEHGYSFTSGNGIYFFHKGDKTWASTDMDQMNRSIQKRFRPIFEVLDLYVDDHHFVGDYVKDVKVTS